MGGLLLSCNCKILKYVLEENNSIKFILDRTPFYAEQGGQTGDRGRLFNSECEIIVDDVRIRYSNALHYYYRLLFQLRCQIH